MGMNIAVFGGSFDPPHLGHKSIIQEALKSLDIDKLFVVPTYLNPFKNEYFLSPKIRLETMQNLTKEMKKVEVIEYEVMQKKKCSTIETIEYFKSKYKLDRIYLIIGADNLVSLDKWYRIDKLKEMVTFVVASRSGIEIPSEFISLKVENLVSSSEIRNGEKTDNEWISRKNS